MSAAGKVIAFRPSPGLRTRIASAASDLEISPGEYARRACEAAISGRRMALTTGGDDRQDAKSALTTVRPDSGVRIEYDEPVERDEQG